MGGSPFLEGHPGFGCFLGARQKNGLSKPKCLDSRVIPLYVAATANMIQSRGGAALIESPAGKAATSFPSTDQLEHHQDLYPPSKGLFYPPFKRVSHLWFVD